MYVWSKVIVCILPTLLRSMSGKAYTLPRKYCLQACQHYPEDTTRRMACKVFCTNHCHLPCQCGGTYVTIHLQLSSYCDEGPSCQLTCLANWQIESKHKYNLHYLAQCRMRVSMAVKVYELEESASCTKSARCLAPFLWAM